MAELNAGAVIDRMRQVADVATDIALGAYFGLGTSAVSNWRKRNSVPYEECVTLSIRKGISLDWLLLGAGVRDERASYTLDVTSDRVQRITAFLRHWEAHRSEDDQAWLEMQLARAVPEYAEWLAARGR